jgi:putative DNA primase/helicase
MTFVDFARAHGLEISDLHPRDKIQRCGTANKPRSTNGSFFWDGRRGWVYAWDGEMAVKWFDDPDAKPWTEEDKAAWKAKQNAQRARQDRNYRQAAERAAEILNETELAEHDYLVRKRLADVKGLVLRDGSLLRKLYTNNIEGLQFDGALLVPMRNLFTNDLQGLQVIAWNIQTLKWEKKMIPGMQAKGAVLRLGPRGASETIFCEGYATGLSIEAAARQMRLNAAALVCFSAGNLLHVANKLTRGSRYVFADHDDTPKTERDKRDRGLPYDPRGPGELTAIETGLPYCMSGTPGFDANDVHAREGLFKVCSYLMQLRRQEADVT